MRVHNQINIGWSCINITPNRPVQNEGQIYQRISQYVHDPIFATCLVLENNKEQLTFVSLDMMDVPVHVFNDLEERLKEYSEIKFSQITFNSTHTHNSTSFGGASITDKLNEYIGKDLLPDIEVPQNILTGREAQGFLLDKLENLIVSAWMNREEGGISFASDYAAVAFNRRPIFENNGIQETTMYGVCSLASFQGFEGTSDHSIDIMYTWDKNRQLTGVVVDVPCPAQVYELHSFISADYWCETRKSIRECLGTVNVLPLCGASGDQNPLDLVRISKTNETSLKKWAAQTEEVFRNFDMTIECQRIGQRISDAVRRGLNTAKEFIDYCPNFMHSFVNLSLTINKVSKMEFDESNRAVEAYKSKYSLRNRMTNEDVVTAYNYVGVIERWFQQQKGDQITIPVHLVRIGEAAFATNPFELFCDYGMRIKARSPSIFTFVIQIANGYAGYLPTKNAINGGSYSTKPASVICGPKCGDTLVERTVSELHMMWS